MQEIIELLARLYQQDVQIMSQPWLWFCVFPAIGYLCFFLAKWTVLTVPIWLPLRIVLRGVIEFQFTRKK